MGNGGEKGARTPGSRRRLPLCALRAGARSCSGSTTSTIKGGAASLELLGSPEVLGIAESLAGANLVPTYEAMVFKDTGNGAPIRWHQDATHPRRYRIFNVDIYLDAACLARAPSGWCPARSGAKVDVCEVEEKYGWEVPGFPGGADAPWRRPGP